MAVRVKRPYGKVCARDVAKIRDIIRKNMKTWSKEFQERPEVIGAKARRRVAMWYDFLKKKVGEAIRAIAIECA